MYYEGESYEVGSNASFSVAGLGIPKGIQAPTVGMSCISNSCTSGKIDGKVNVIHFDSKQAVSLGPGACSIKIQDMFQSKPCPTHGDSGGAFWNVQGYILGIVTYGSGGAGGVRNTRCSAYNPSAIHMPQVLGVTCGDGIVGGGSTSTPAQQQQKRRTSKGWDYSYHATRYNFPTGVI